jgi:hypothetical protein
VHTGSPYVNLNILKYFTILKVDEAVAGCGHSYFRGGGRVGGSFEPRSLGPA